MNTANSSSPFDLSGKVAVVTGSTRGIGLAIVRQFCRAGAACAISSEDDGAVRRVTERLAAEGFRVGGTRCNVTSASDQTRLIEKTLAAFGGIDILVCNAGISGRAGPATALDPDDYRRVFDVNLHSMVALSNLAYPHLKSRGGGSLVFMASIAALRGNESINGYALAKAGVTQLARNLAVQWGPDNIRANAIAPGLIRSEFSAPLLNDENFMRRRMAMTPLRRPGEMAEVAAAAQFLASDAAAFVTGQTLVVDGGTTITDGS